MNGDMPCLAAAAIADQISMNTAPPVGERSWPYLEFLRNTPVFSRESQASAGELNNSVSPSWRGLAVRPTRRPGQQGQHHAPPGSFLGRLDQEFPQRDIDVNIVEFELKAAFTSAEQTTPAVALFSRPTRLSSSRSARVILIRRWQPAMAHLTGTLLGISLILQRQLKEGDLGHARRAARHFAWAAAGPLVVWLRTLQPPQQLSRPEPFPGSISRTTR